MAKYSITGAILRQERIDFHSGPFSSKENAIAFMKKMVKEKFIDSTYTPSYVAYVVKKHNLFGVKIISANVYTEENTNEIT